MKAFFMIGALSLMPGYLGCGWLSGACTGEYAAGKIICKQGWDQAECDEWDTLEINGSRWTFHAGSSCNDLGYSNRCPPGENYVAGSCP
jgi:hypothetical protein